MNENTPAANLLPGCPKIIHWRARRKLITANFDIHSCVSVQPPPPCSTSFKAVVYKNVCRRRVWTDLQLISKNCELVNAIEILEEIRVCRKTSRLMCCSNVKAIKCDSCSIYCKASCGSNVPIRKSRYPSETRPSFICGVNGCCKYSDWGSIKGV